MLGWNVKDYSQATVMYCSETKIMLGKVSFDKMSGYWQFYSRLLSCFLGLVVQGSSDLSPLPQKGDH